MKYFLYFLFVILQLKNGLAESNASSESGSSSGSGSNSGDGIMTSEYLPFQKLGSTPEVNKQCLKRRLDGASPAINIPIGFPIGYSIQSKAYVGTNGIISFDEPFLYWYPSPFPTRWGSTRRRYVVAPYWSDNDIRMEGDVCYEVHNKESDLMERISNHISYKSRTTFTGNWMLLVEWSDVHPYPHGSLNWWWWSYYNNIREFAQKVNTYQAVVITDGVTSYSLFTYHCGMLEWSGYWRHATIGYNSGGRLYRNDKLTGLSEAKYIGCRNDYSFNNIIYQLSISSDVIQQLRKRCYDMHRDDIKMHKDIEDIYMFLEPCPCTWWQGWRDRRFAFQWQAWYDGSLCHRQRFPTKEASQFCCYSSSWPGWGSLKTAQSTSDWGTNMLRYHPSRYYSKFVKYDQEFRRTCCSAGLCSLYYERRPTDNCSRYRPPRRTWFWGDPHITTLDGLQYTFNGLGEFILFELNDDSFTMQGKTDRVSDDVEATKFSSLAFKENTSETIEIKVDSDSNFVVYVNQTDITSMLSDTNDTYNNTDGSIELTRQDTNSMLVAFANGISATVNITLNMLDFTLALPEKFINQTRGLLGNYNGIKDDDIEDYNGTTSYQNATKLNESVIYDVASTWRVKDNDSSLFVLPNPDPDSSFMPTFLNISAANQSVIAACGNNTACIIDASLTGNTSIGLNTLNISNVNVAEMNELANFPPTITGNDNVTVYNNIPTSYNFSVNDTQSVSVSVDGVEPTNGVLHDEGNGEWSYTFTWNIMQSTSFSLSFVATDTLNASSTLVPLFVICGCINNGNCTYDDIVDTTLNTIVLPCDCIEDVWEGEYCQNDADGCEYTTCFDDVTCTDNPAPMTGATCGPCPEGYSGNGTRCNDIDECSNGTDLCEQKCVNSEGSYHCECMNGYQLRNATHCKDIDECASYNECHQYCNNTIGSFYCTCWDGLELASDNVTCEGITPCLKPTLGSHLNCTVDNNGNNVYFCDRGFELLETNPALEEYKCIDINECMIKGACEQNCTNTLGSFNCSCGSGFKVSDDHNRTCIDIDECLDNAMSNDNPLCNDERICNNTASSYECICPPGTVPINEENCEICPSTSTSIPTATTATSDTPTPTFTNTPSTKSTLPLPLEAIIAIGAGGGVGLALLIIIVTVCIACHYKKKAKKRVAIMPVEMNERVIPRQQIFSLNSYKSDDSWFYTS